MSNNQSPKIKRNKGKDKLKDRQKKYGKFTSKNVRQTYATMFGKDKIVVDFL